MRCLIVVLVLVVSSTASAQPSLAPVAEPGDKDPAIAGLLAGGATLGGFLVVKISADRESVGGMIAGGAILAVGPSAGHIYAGQGDRAVAMSLVRTAGLGIQLLGAKWWVESVFPDGEAERGREGSGLLLMLAGATLYSAAAAIDIRDAPKAAHRHNARRRSLVVVAPGYLRTPAGNGVPTVALSGSF